MAAARIAACSAAARTDLAFEPAPPETLDVVRRQRQLLRRAAALCLDPIAEETDGGVDSASSSGVPSLIGRSQTTTSALPAPAAGRMKLFGTHIYPKNKYLTLQMIRSGKGVICEDVFESLIQFLIFDC